MIFPFLKYVNITWYFNLMSGNNVPYFIDVSLLPATFQQLIDRDGGYSTQDVSKRDAAYQAWHKGFIFFDPKLQLKLDEIKPTVADNYRFIKRFFHPFWTWYVWVLRLLTLHNPFTETAGFIRSLKVKRIPLYEKVFDHQPEYLNFKSQLLDKHPWVSVVIPTLNRYQYLKDVLSDLEKQDYPNFEVIVVDQSEPFQPDFYKDFKLDLKVIRQEEKALWLARNTAIQNAKSEFLLLFDDDSRVEPDWISQHLKCLDYFDADISSGVSISLAGAKVPENYSYFRWGDQVDTGNVMIRKDVFRKIGLFDRQFEAQRMGDGEFGLRAYLAGFKNISNPLAKRLHLKVSEGGLRQMGHWDAFRPKSWLAPRPVPSVLYLIRKYFGNKAALFEILISVPPSIMPYRYKRKPFLLLLGSFLVIPLLPMIIWQVIRSWRRSSQMLKTGPIILYYLNSEN